MDPCPFVRILVRNLGLNFTDNKTQFSQSSFYCKFKLKGFQNQVSDVSLLASENDVVENKTHSCFDLSKIELEKILAEKKLSNSSSLLIKIYRRNRVGNSGGKLLGRVSVQLDLKGILENSGNRVGCVIRSGWVLIDGSGLKLHLDVRAEPDPRFVFRFDGDPECSPQVFQVNGNVKQPVFTCKFGFRNHHGERNLRSRSSLPEPSTSTGCLCSLNSSKDDTINRERKGWSVTIHDLSGSPVAAASMVTPFVPSPGKNRVEKSNPGAWLILRPSHNTWKPWGRLEAWRAGSNRLGYRFELSPDGGSDTVQLAQSTISTKNGGEFNIDVINGPTPLTTPSGSFDFGSGSGSGSGSDFSGSGSGSWGQLLYRGFVMSSTVAADGRQGSPEVVVGVQHVSCTEDAAAFVALAAAVDLSVDACRLFSKKLRKELRQEDFE